MSLAVKLSSIRSKFWRDDADDGETFAVEREALANDIGRGAELAFPEAGADERDRGGADLVVGAKKAAAQ